MLTWGDAKRVTLSRARPAPLAWHRVALLGFGRDHASE